MNPHDIDKNEKLKYQKGSNKYSSNFKKIELNLKELN